MDKNRNHILHLGEKKLEGIVYNENPLVTFTSARIDGTDTNVEGHDYVTHFSFTYDVMGSFWIDYIQYTFVQENWNNYWNPFDIKKDGDYSASGTASYSKSSTASHQSYFTIHLKNGGTTTSSNSLYFSGKPISGVSISGGIRSTQTRGISSNNRSDNDLNVNKCILIKKQNE